MGCSILGWNIRGVVRVRGKKRIRELIRLHNPLIVVLLGVPTQFTSVEKFWNGLGFRPIIIEEARGLVVVCGCF